MTTSARSLSEKVRREKEALLSAPPQIDTERLQFMLEVYAGDRMEPNVMRRARLFHELCARKTIYIDDNPLAGTLTRFKYGAYPFPEEGCAWMERGDVFALPRGKVKVTPEVRQWVNKAVDLWRDSNLFSVTQDVVQKVFNVDIRTLSKCGVWMEASPGGASHIVVPDYATVLGEGLTGVKARVEESQRQLNTGNEGALDKWYLYEGMKLCLDGMMLLAKRYAALVRETAAVEKDAARKRELEEMAATCDQVPAGPARTLREAVQSFWFVMLGVWLEAPKALQSPPATFARAMHSYYLKDLDEGRVTREDAIELVEFFFLKINQLAHVLPPHGFRFNQSRLGQQLGLGGLTPDGRDATTEFDWLVLEAQLRLRVPEPLVNLVYHDRLSEDFLLKCVDLIRTGVGQPAFHNARVGIERHLLHHRMPLEEARTFAIAGCVQSGIPGCTDGYWEARLNVAKALEFVLNNGCDPLTGLGLGVPTGDPDGFGTWDDFRRAFIRQLAYILPLTHDVSRTAWGLQRRFPAPFGSSLVNDCIKTGKDVCDGGARYSFADGVCLVGVVDAANSLAAIKKLVYEDKKLTMAQLRAALAADFAGHEDIEKMCLDAPKYGNDDDHADAIVAEIYDICYRLHPKTDHLGRPVAPSAYSVTAHSAAGEFTGALPNGKHARKPLVDAAISAQGGTDKNGPTALVRSAARVLDGVKYGSTHLNMKFHPDTLKGREGAKKLLALIKTYFDLGGYHVQFNCVSGETLRDAQLHPEKYRELIVRVAGFSAYYVNLDKDVQEDIIRRTELRL